MSYLHIDMFINQKIVLDRHYGKGNNLAAMSIHGANVGDTKHYQFFILVYVQLLPKVLRSVGYWIE